jgi:hypothetical protein
MASWLAIGSDIAATAPGSLRRTTVAPRCADAAAGTRYQDRPIFKAFHWKGTLLLELPNNGLLGQYTNALVALSRAGARGQTWPPGNGVIHNPDT